jgi:hypothetical protein
MLKKVVTLPSFRLMTAAVSVLLALSTSSTASAQTNYADVGTSFLNKLQTSYLKTLANSHGSSVALYANLIDPNTGNTKSAAVAEMWSEENMIRALMWGTLVNPTQFRPLLMTAVQQTDWYQGGCEGGSFGYGDVQGGTCFFDDNALLGGVLMDTYLKVNTSSNPALKGNGPTVLAHTNNALNYVEYWASQDPHGGVPQKPVDLGQGNFYMNPVLRVSLANVDYGQRFNNSGDITYGQNYYTEVHNTAMGLLLSSGLFRGGTQFVNGAWVPNDTGPLPGDSTSVAALALALYRAGDTSKLADAENLMDLVVAQWVAPSGAVSADAVNGGYAIVDLLCQLYQVDGKQQYLDNAKSIIDYLLNNTRDTAGWFPNGTGDAGSWDQVRTGSAPDDQTTLLTQSAAAAAILEFAYTRQNAQ